MPFIDVVLSRASLRPGALVRALLVIGYTEDEAEATGEESVELAWVAAQLHGELLWSPSTLPQLKPILKELMPEKRYREVLGGDDGADGGAGDGAGRAAGSRRRSSASSTSLRDMADIVDGNGISLFASPPQIVAAALQLRAGQVCSYTYEARLPTDLPPSFREGKVRFQYALTVTASRGMKETVMQHSLLRVTPFCLPGSPLPLLLDGRRDFAYNELSRAFELRGDGKAEEDAEEVTALAGAVRLKPLGMLASTLGAQLPKEIASLPCGKPARLSVRMEDYHVGYIHLLRSCYRPGEEIVVRVDFADREMATLELRMDLVREDSCGDGSFLQRRVVASHSSSMLHKRNGSMFIGLPSDAVVSFTSPVLSSSWSLVFYFRLLSRRAAADAADGKDGEDAADKLLLPAHGTVVYPVAEADVQGLQFTHALHVIAADVADGSPYELLMSQTRKAFPV